MKRPGIVLVGALLLLGLGICLILDSILLPLLVLGGLLLIGGIAFRVIDAIFPLKVILHMMKKVKIEAGELGKVEQDIVFKTVGKQALKLDVYLPLNGQTENIPVTIYVHGGAWLFGDKGDILRLRDAYKIMQTLRRKGHAVVSINHRLLKKGETHLHHVLSDCKDAVRWVRKHASTYHFDANSIGIWGQSSGGHAALLVGLTEDQQFVGDPSLAPHAATVNFILNHYGPSDLSDFFRMHAPRERNWFLRRLLAASLDETGNASPEQQVLALSASSYIRKDAPPLLVLHGSADSVVGIQQSQSLVEKSKVIGAPVTYWFIEGLEHAFAGASEEITRLVIERSVNFVLENSSLA